MDEQAQNLIAIWELPLKARKWKPVFLWVYEVDAGFEVQSACGLAIQAGSINQLWASVICENEEEGGECQFEVFEAKEEENTINLLTGFDQHACNVIGVNIFEQ